MMDVTSYYDVKVVEITISGNDDLGYFEDKITFIFDNLHDNTNGRNTLYQICEKKVNDLMVGTQTIYNAFAIVYTLDRQVINQFDVL